MDVISHGLNLNRVELLTSENYHIWALKISAILRSKKLFKIAIENEEVPISEGPNGDTKSRAEWEDKNDEAFGIIIVSLSSQQACQFLGETNARKVWSELKRIYAGNTHDRAIDATMELKEIKMTSKETVDEYIARGRGIASKCASLGKLVDERELTYHIVRGVGQKFETIASVLRPQRGIKLEDIAQALREEEKRIKEKENNSASTSSAYKAKERKGQGKKCYSCGKIGHISKDCWYRRDNNEKNNFKKRDDYQKGNYRGLKENKRHNETIHENKTFYVTVKTKQQAYAVQTKNKVETMWGVDSGCTSHMTNQIEKMINIQEYNGKVIVAEENREIEATAVGDIKVKSYVNGTIYNVTIRNVLYVPKLRINLLSVRSLAKQGNYIIINEHGAKIYDKQRILVAQSEDFEDMYMIRLQDDDVKENTETSYAAKILSEKELWHKRLGHLNEAYMDKMINAGVVEGMKYAKIKLPICVSCVKGKMHKEPFNTINTETSRQRLELLHTDLCGPIRPSLSGSKYIMTIIDDYTRRVFVFFIKHKNEVYEYFSKFIRAKENETEQRIKYVRSDNGTEYVNENFAKLFDEKGIRHQRTVPGNPQSNGIAERMNRTLIDKSRSMLEDAKLPDRFWAEAVSTAAYLHNCSSNKHNSVKTPIELWTDRKPNISHLRKFGCVCYFYKRGQDKLANRAKEGIFIGYSKTRNAYRIFEPKTEKVYEERSVKFNEELPGGTLYEKKNRRQEENELKYIIELSENSLNKTNVPEIEENDEQENDFGNTNNEEELETTEEENKNTQEIIEENITIQESHRGRRKGITIKQIRQEHERRLAENEARLIQDGARRSERIKNKNQVHHTIINKDLPRNVKEALESSEHEKWKQAMEEEIASMNKHEVWDIVPRRKDIKIMKSKWIFNIKEDAEGGNKRYKARLVANGYNARPGIDFHETHSPVMRMESIRTLLAIAAKERFKVRMYDVKTAYLHGNIQEEIFMEQPEGFAEDNKSVCKLKKSIYGLPQSGRNWYEKLSRTLEELGFKRTASDPCVFHRQDGVIIGIYVDDLLVIGTNDKILDADIKRLRKFFELTRTQSKFLGIEITEDESGIYMNQSNYIDTILQRFKMEDCNIAKTPKTMDTNLDEFQESPKIDEGIYMEMLGSLMYLSTSTRPDLCHTVSALGQYSKDPRQVHLTALKRAYRYIKWTKNLTLKFDRKYGILRGISDASWDSTRDSKSFSGYTTQIGNSTIGWKSKKQKTVALSTCESELTALNECNKEIKWEVGLLDELKLNKYFQIPVIIETDSQAAQKWILNRYVTARTKHVNRLHNSLREENEQGHIKIIHTSTEDNLADVLTKAVSEEKMKKAMERFSQTRRDIVESKGGIDRTSDSTMKNMKE